MNCQYYDNNFETCTNGDCPFCSDFCPVTENQEVCRYSELDDTETMLRRCLDAEKEDSREAIQALAEENKDLKKQLEKVKAERDTAVADVCAIIGEVEEIRRGYGVDNADADGAFAGLCESYCDNYGHGCYKESSDGYYCANFKWRGQKEE